jgi:predicted methyltransferase
MNVRPLSAALFLVGLSACSSAPEPEPVLPVASASEAPAPVAPPETATAVATATPELTPEQKKKAQDAAEFEEDKAAFAREQQSEGARWTPDLHAATKALADKKYPTGKAAIAAMVAGQHRFPGHAARDTFRHPVETFDFLGFKPTMTVLEYGPGEGWVTELLAPALSAKGKLYVTTSDPNGPAGERSTFSGQRFKAFLDRSPEAYSKVQTVIIDGKAPKLDMDGKLDMIVLFRGVHGMQNNGKLQDWLAEMHKALKPNGILGIEQHRAKDGDAVETTSKNGYVPEKWLIGEVEKAGFKLAAKSDINANPKDTKDYAEGVWTLPPTFRLKDKDHDKYAGIGESDRMTLKFTKVNVPAPKADKPTGTSPPKTTKK